jgi:uncharacterized protein (TIGR00369 family)
LDGNPIILEKHERVRRRRAAAATLLDSACGCAIHSKLSAVQAFATLELKIAFHRALTRDTGLVRAEAQIVSFGRRVAYAEGRLVDGIGRLYASASVTALVFDRDAKPGSVSVSKR